MLLADDDRAIRDALRRALTLSGYAVTAVADGVQAIAMAGKESFDVIVLDVMMPGVDGLAVCKVLRAQGTSTPILLLTARVQTPDRVAGLDAGADDYLAKPFDLDELLARLRALLRRAGMPVADSVDAVPEPIQVGALRLDVPGRRASYDGREMYLTKTEFALLELLARHAGVALEHATIYDRIWGYDFGPESKNLAVYVSYLRRKLAAVGARDIIKTVRGVGYMAELP